ncbi:MAG TPA: DUF1800 family protein [Verrucomicrobiae bacterium]|nr:DUF1800 family protein [Verrucomicrobiae bacterium]
MKLFPCLLAGAVAVGAIHLRADDYSAPPPPTITNFTVQGAQRDLRFPLYPAVQAYTFLSTSNLVAGFGADTNFFPAAYTNVAFFDSGDITNISYEWRATNAAGPVQLYRLQATPLSSSALLTAQVLNRLAYGPTPDELERVAAIGPDAYIAEQLNMDGIPETSDTYVVDVTNSAAPGPATNWVRIVASGKLNGTNLFVYLTQPGSVLIDDVQLFEGTNAAGPNLLLNGDFESALTPPWTLAAGYSGSFITNGVAHAGSRCLNLVAAAGGANNTASAVWQPFVTSLTNNAIVTVSYWYLPTANSSKLTVGVSGSSGLLASAGDLPADPTWVYCTATGRATATNSQVFFFPSGAGTCYIDDVKLVAGTVPEAGPNLLVNGGFETGALAPWITASNFTNSAISAALAHSGSNSLQFVATAGGRAQTNGSVFQSVALATNQVYTLSYWYGTATPNRTLTTQVTGGQINSTPDTDTGGLYRRLSTANGTGIDDLRAWYCQHAVNSPRQLLEVLSQFWENHFVTQYQKSYDYLNAFYSDGTVLNRLAADWEWREMTRWRNAMLNPQCTFYDLLKISAESPAMIVYLDTVGSKANGNNVANENYARELLELFTFGVDNGYDQNDIIAMSRAWTGWSVELVDAANANNPFAPPSVTYQPGIASQSKSNIVGVWAFNYKAGNHGTNRAPIFSVWDTTTTNLVALGPKTVPARFGPPWAGRYYQLALPARATGTTNSIQDGYDVIAHLANQPFTEEYLSVKLCRLFVHDDFPNPTCDQALTNDYAFYDYTDPNHSAEAELVHQCMLAWENSVPKGQIRPVLNVIFQSNLFRGHGGSLHKVKTPLEFVASSVRALRASNPDGTTTAGTDGYSFKTPLDRMGAMSLFNRQDPNGYPESAAGWISAGTLVERLRYDQAYCIAAGGSGRSDAGNNVCNPVALLKLKVPSGSWNDSGAVADYFLGILFPGEGAGNLVLYRSAAVNFLNLKDDGVTPDPFSGLSNTSSTYDTRVRGMVAMLLTMPRFQEQ